MNRLVPLFLMGCLAAACSRPNASVPAHPWIISHDLENEDLLSPGGEAFDVLDYSLPPSADNDVLDPAPEGKVNPPTQLAGRVFLPRASAPAAVLVFLHGNHSTCGTYPPNWDPAHDPRFDLTDDFTWRGSCPEGYTEVPSHKGYDYAASQLASFGYAVISINANLGVTGRNDFDNANWSLVVPRARLILRTLEQFHTWNTSGGAEPWLGRDLRGRLDFSQVGMMGHSRGGEGVRVAYNMYRGITQSTFQWRSGKPEIGFRGVFEIGPIDGGSNNGAVHYEVSDIPWTVLVPGCDGDVSNYAGMNPYGRMLGVPSAEPRSVFVVWGANHNFFNTEWQTSDSTSCAGPQRPLWNSQAPQLTVDDRFHPPNNVANSLQWYLLGAYQGIKGSTAQQDIGRAAMTAFFRAHVGRSSDKRLARVFDPQYALPRSLASLAPISREFSLVSQGTTLQPLGIGSLIRESESVQAVGLQEYLAQRVELARAQLVAEHGEKIEVSHDPLAPRASMVLRWKKEGDKVPFVNLDLSSAGPLSAFRFLDLSLERLDEKLCLNPDAACEGPLLETDFSLILENGQGRSSLPVHISDYVRVSGFAGTLFRAPYTWQNEDGTPVFYLNIAEPTFDMVPVELGDFRGSDGQPFPLEGVSRVRMVFDRTKEAAVIVGDVRLVRER